MRPRPRVLRALLLALLALLACRETGEAPVRLLEEGFETSCEGLPCGWAQAAGPDGAATWVSTVHPGERGLRLEGEGTAALGPGAEGASVTVVSGALEAAVSGRCDEGTALAIAVSVVAPGPRPVPADGFAGEARLPTEWSGTTFTPLVGTTALLDGGIGPGGWFLEVRSVRLEVVGPGACEIDHLILDGVGASDPAGPDAC